MRNLSVAILYSLLAILIATALLSLFGVGYMWYTGAKELPFLGWMLGFAIADGVALVLTFARRGMRYMPRVIITKTEQETLAEMQKLIANATSVVIVSNRASWLVRADALSSLLAERRPLGVSAEIITRERVECSVRATLEVAGVSFIETQDPSAPEARFTLINGDRAGAEMLAIARGVHPEHEITIFDNDSGPQIIALAKDIVRKSRELARSHISPRDRRVDSIAKGAHA